VTFNSVIDLPLNSGQSPHVFTIRLKRIGSDEIPFIETWGRLIGEAKDNQGNPLANVQVVLTNESGNSARVASSTYGHFHLSARPGKYSLQATAPNGDQVKFEDISLAPGPTMKDISITFNTKSNKINSDNNEHTYIWNN
jgi:hypothetical protein